MKKLLSIICLIGLFSLAEFKIERNGSNDFSVAWVDPKSPTNIQLTTTLHDSEAITFGLSHTNATLILPTNFVSEYTVVPRRQLEPGHVSANILRRIITETNVLTGNNQRGCPICASLRNAPGGMTFAVHHPQTSECSTPFQPETERWTITNIIRKVYIEICSGVGEDTEWFAVERVLSTTSTTNRMKLHTEWRAE